LVPSRNEALSPDMLHSNGAAILVNAFSSIIYYSIFVLLLFHANRDRKSRALLWLMLVLAQWSTFDVVLRLLHYTNTSVHSAFLYFTFLTAWLPYSLYSFTIEYFNVWNVRHRFVQALIFTSILIVTCLLLVEGIAQSSLIFERTSINVTDDGAVLYEHGPLLAVDVTIVTLEECLLLYTLYLAAKKTGKDGNRWILAGIVTLGVGMIIIPIPRYTLEQFFYFSGSLLLTWPVLRKRIFDPVSHLNMELSAQATELRITLEENKRLIAQVNQANDATVKIVSVVGHELRNRVGDVINIGTGMLEEPDEYGGQPLPEAYQLDARLLVKTGRNMKELLDDIVDWGQIESGNLHLSIKPVDPVPLLQEVLHFAAIAVNPGVQVCADLPPSLPPINADELRLKQILRNLVNNAGKFTKVGSVTLGAQQDGQYVCFKVSDTGPGIKPEEQGRLFQAYSQASNTVPHEHGGNGLGLHICQQLVQLHQGTIWLSSTLAQGTTFYFTIPIADATRAETSGSDQ